MEYIKSCSVFGHSEIDINEDLKNRLWNKFESLIKENFGKFYFGGFGAFDELCWEIVTKLKEKYPYIKRVFCLTDPKHQSVSKRPKWLTEEDYEEIVYLDLVFDYWYKRIYFRNIETINRSDYIVFYVRRTQNSGAYKAMQYAIRKKKPFVNMSK